MLADSRRRVLPLAVALASVPAYAQDGASRAPASPSSPAPDAPAERPIGLPPQIHWTFNFDAGWGNFGFANSIFNDPKEHVGQDLGDHWFEAFVKPALGATYTLPSSSELYGRTSAVGERTYATPPPLVGPVESSFFPEDLSIGWRSGKAFESLGDKEARCRQRR